MKQELNLLDGYTPTSNLLNDAKQRLLRYPKRLHAAFSFRHQTPE